MTIYKIKRGAGSPFRLMRFVNERDGEYAKWEHLGSPMPISHVWVPPKLRFYEAGETGIAGDSKHRPRSVATDMPYVYEHGLVIVSERLVDRCGDVLRQFGEFLPVECNQGQFYAYHCTNVVDCLDEERSRLSRSAKDGHVLNVYEPVFRVECLMPQIVFRLPVGNPEVVYCDDRVYALLTAPPLQGVTANPVWHSD